MGMRDWWVLLCLLWPGVAMAGPIMEFSDVSLGSNPIQSFHGELAATEERALVAVPADQEFIITAVLHNSSVFEILQDTTVVVGRTQLAFFYFRKGISRVVIQPGTVLSIRHPHTSGAPEPFYLQGYFAPGGGPHRFSSGETSATVPTTIFTNDGHKPFVLRTMILTQSTHCITFLDGDEVFASRMLGSYESIIQTQGVFGNRLGTLMIPVGSELQISATPGSEANCKYFMEGEYITP